ncbi:hypothetical protein [Haloferula sp.]|uniref:hypothetical protein n=1 Tax=Haloferula sp. TaxID=2497595 RepID=UPI00329AA6FD
MRALSIAIATLSLGLSYAAEEDAVLIDAPSVSVTLEGSGKVLRYERCFYLTRKAAQELYEGIAFRRIRPIEAVEAIEAAKASVFLGDAPDPLAVTKLELLKVDVGPHEELEYFLITVRASGSEEYRVVLLDGTVLKPELKPAGPETR